MGIEYFSHDVDIMQDNKIRFIKAKHGLIGYAIYLRLLEDIYRDKGYYMFLDDDVNILFCDDNNLDYDTYILILNDLILKDLFNKKLYDKYKILTSKRIQQNYLMATERRINVEFLKEYILINAELEKQNVNIISLNVDIKDENGDILTQSKVNESKENKSRVNKDCCKEEIPPLPPSTEPVVIELKLNNNTDFPIYESQVLKWQTLYPNVDIMQQLRSMVGWLDANPKKRKTKSGVLSFVNTWLSKEQNKGGNKNGTDYTNNTKTATTERTFTPSRS